MLAVVGRDAEAKARAAGNIILERVRRAGVRLSRFLVECLGAGDVAPGVIRPASPPFEVVLRVTVRDPDRAAVERFCRELAPLVTVGAAGHCRLRGGPAITAAGVRLLARPGAACPGRRADRVEVQSAAEWATAS